MSDFINCGIGFGQFLGVEVFLDGFPQGFDLLDCVGVGFGVLLFTGSGMLVVVMIAILVVVILFTVIVIMDPDSRIVPPERFHREDWSPQVARIKGIAGRYNDARLTVDTTGAGEPIFETLRTASVRVDRRTSVVPGVVGATVFVGTLPATAAVTGLAAAALPVVSVPVTTTRSVEPTSAETTVYVVPVAARFTQLPPP